MLYKTTLSWKHFIQIDELQTQVWQDTCRTEVWTSSLDISIICKVWHMAAKHLGDAAGDRASEEGVICLRRSVCPLVCC